MQKALIILILLCAANSVVLAQSTPPLRAKEIDGSPSRNGITTIEVSNGTLTINGRVATIVTGGGSGANPTATIGLAAVNGSATTFLRSDGAPALSQAIAPTWTGAHIFTVSAPAISIDNATTAAADILLDVQHSSTGTPAAGFGSRLQFRLESSTTANRDAAAMDAVWTNATDATRTSDIVFNTVNSAATQESFRITGNALPVWPATNTASGTTGAQTINKPSGTINFAAAASSLVVTNSLVTTNSIVFAVKRTNDATCQIQSVVPASGSFTVSLTAGCAAETSVGFFVINK